MKKAIQKFLLVVLSSILLIITGCGNNPEPLLTNVVAYPIKYEQTLTSPLSEGLGGALTIADRKHDVVALQVYDKRETEIPAVGLIKLKDAETGADLWVDSSNKRLREYYAKHWEKQQADLAEIFKQSRVDNVSVETNEDYVRALIQLFKQRA